MDGMLERMPSRLLSEWMAYFSLEPFGEERADLRSAVVAKTMADIWRGQNDEPAPLERFMPLVKRSRREPRRQPWEQQLALVEILNKAMGGRDLRGKR